LIAREKAMVEQIQEEPNQQENQDYGNFELPTEKPKKEKIKKDKSHKSNFFGVMSLILTILCGLFAGVALVFKQFGDKLKSNETIYNLMQKVFDLVTTNAIVIIVVCAVLVISLLFAIIQLIRKGGVFSWIN
jgi:uncharacterized membrane protein YhaH (DUF805 family)